MTTIQNSQSQISTLQYNRQNTQLPEATCQIGQARMMRPLPGYLQPLQPFNQQSGMGQEIGAAIQQALQPMVQMFESLLSKFSELLSGLIGSQAGKTGVQGQTPGSGQVDAQPQPAPAPGTAVPGNNVQVGRPPEATPDAPVTPDTKPAPETAPKESKLDKVFGAIKMIYEGATEIAGLSKGLGKKVSKGLKSLGGVFSKAISTAGNYIMDSSLGKAASKLLSKVF